MKEGIMKRVLLYMVIITIFMSAGCLSNIPDYERVEIEALIERYGNALLIQNHDLAKSCLVPGGPSDQNFELRYQIIVNILTTQPEYTGQTCSIPIYGVKTGSIKVNGEWANVKLESRQVCGFWKILTGSLTRCPLPNMPCLHPPQETPVPRTSINGFVSKTPSSSTMIPSF